MEVVTRETQLNIGDCIYYKDISNIHPEATYVGVINYISPYIFTMRMKPIESTMGEQTYLGNISRTYDCSVIRNLIGTDEISVKRYNKNFKIDNPETEARLICEKHNLKFLKMVGKYGFLYQNSDFTVGNNRFEGDIYEDDVRLFKMEKEFDK